MQKSHQPSAFSYQPTIVRWTRCAIPLGTFALGLVLQGGCFLTDSEDDDRSYRGSGYCYDCYDEYEYGYDVYYEDEYVVEDTYYYSTSDLFGDLFGGYYYEDDEDYYAPYSFDDSYYYYDDGYYYDDYDYGDDYYYDDGGTYYEDWWFDDGAWY